MTVGRTFLSDNCDPYGAPAVSKPISGTGRLGALHPRQGTTSALLQTPRKWEGHTCHEGLDGSSRSPPLPAPEGRPS